jgi:hypothetical protein
LLTASPYNLILGDSVYAKLVANNFYGESIESDAQNGAVILLVPSAPLNLADDEPNTTASVISFSWENGESTGGSPVLDYRISYEQTLGNWVVLTSGVTSKYYQTQVPLAAGSTYSFTVESRNSVGFSLPSAELSILCA